MTGTNKRKVHFATKARVLAGVAKAIGFRMSESELLELADSVEELPDTMYDVPALEKLKDKINGYEDALLQDIELYMIRPSKPNVPMEIHS